MCLKMESPTMLKYPYKALRCGYRTHEARIDKILVIIFTLKHSRKYMTFLNKGYCYNVYDLGNGRVRKFEKGFLKKIIDGYVENIFESWKQGFSDRVYNFTINNGIDKNRNIILLYFNEITLFKDEVLKRI